MIAKLYEIGTIKIKRNLMIENAIRRYVVILRSKSFIGLDALSSEILISCLQCYTLIHNADGRGILSKFNQILKFIHIFD